MATATPWLGVHNFSSLDFQCVGNKLRIIFPSDSLVDNGDGTYTHTDVDGNVQVINTVTPIVVNDGDTADFTLTGDGSPGNPWTLTGEVILDPNPLNILSSSPAGLLATETVTTLVDNGDGSFTYTREDGTPVTLSICAMLADCAVTADAVDDVVAGSIVGQRLTGGVSANDTMCSIGTTTFQLTGAPVNATVPFFDQASGVYTVLPTAAGAWSFQYQILCNGVVTDTATVSGVAVAVTANAVNDSVGDVPLQGFDDYVSHNDTPCSVGTTTFQLGALTNVTVPTFNAITGFYNAVPVAAGAWNFVYNILCDGVVIDSATVSGNAVCDGSSMCGCVACGDTVTPTVNDTLYGLQADILVPFTLNPRVTPGVHEIISIDWGDGTSNNYPTNTNSVLHVYTAGKYTITGTVRNRATGAITTHAYYNMVITAGGNKAWEDAASGSYQFNGAVGNFRVTVDGTVDTTDCENPVFIPTIGLAVPTSITANSTEFRLHVNGVSQTQLVNNVVNITPVVGWSDFGIPTSFGPIIATYEWREVGNGNLIATGSMIIENYCV